MDRYPKANLHPEAFAAFERLTSQTPEAWATVTNAKDRQAMWLMFLSGWIARESFGNL